MCLSSVKYRSGCLDMSAYTLASRMLLLLLLLLLTSPLATALPGDDARETEEDKHKGGRGEGGDEDETRG